MDDGKDLSLNDSRESFTLGELLHLPKSTRWTKSLGEVNDAGRKLNLKFRETCSDAALRLELSTCSFKMMHLYMLNCARLQSLALPIDGIQLELFKECHQRAGGQKYTARHFPYVGVGLTCFKNLTASCVSSLLHSMTEFRIPILKLVDELAKRPLQCSPVVKMLCFLHACHARYKLLIAIPQLCMRLNVI